MSGTSSGWTVAALADACTLITDGTHHSPENGAHGEFKYITAKNIKKHGVQLDDVTFVDRRTHEEIYRRCPVTKGDILYIKDGATTGIAAINQIDDPFSLLSSVALIRPHPKAIVPEFLWHQLNSQSLRAEMLGGMTGSAIRRLTLSAIGRQAVQVCPLPEQRRIVAKIDSLTAKSARARASLDHIPRLVQKYKQAILVAAFRGDLTRDWRRSRSIEEDRKVHRSKTREIDQASLPCNWKISSIQQVTENHDNMRIPIRARDRVLRSGEYDYYGASGVIDKIDGYIFEGEYLLIGEDGANLISRKTDIAFLVSGRFWVNNHAHILESKDEVTNEWICRYINMIDLKPYVTGSAQPKLTQSALNNIEIPLPDPSEQDEILRRIRIAFAWIDRLAAEATSARKLVDKLDQAILAKAFRGELVPQDPNDEPASVLLDRIRAERAGSPAKKARGRPRKSG